MKFLERDHPVIPPVPSPIKMLIFLLWNRIWSSRSVKVTNIPPVFLCSSLHFYQGIQINVWWIILRGPKPTPSLCLADLAFGIPNPKAFVGLVFPLTVVGHPLQLLTFPCCFQDAPHFLWCSQAPFAKWWVPEFSHQQWWEAIRYLQVLHSLHLVTQPFAFLPLSHRVSLQALFCIDWSQLSHHLLLNQFSCFLTFTLASCLYFVLDQPIWIVLVYFLGTCLCWRQMLLSDAELIQLKEVGFI